MPSCTTTPKQGLNEHLLPRTSVIQLQNHWPTVQGLLTLKHQTGHLPHALFLHTQLIGQEGLGAFINNHSKKQQLFCPEASVGSPTEEGLVHGRFPVPQHQLSAPLDEVEHHSPLLQLRHVAFPLEGVEPQPVLDKLVDPIDPLVLAELVFVRLLGDFHFRVGHLPALEVQLVVGLRLVSVLLLQLQQEIVHDIEQVHVLLHVKRAALPGRAEHCKKGSQLFRAGKAPRPLFVLHKNLCDLGVEAFCPFEVAPNQMVLPVHVEVELHCADQQTQHLQDLFSKFIICDVVGLRNAFGWHRLGHFFRDERFQEVATILQLFDFFVDPTDFALAGTPIITTLLFDKELKFVLATAEWGRLGHWLRLRRRFFERDGGHRVGTGLASAGLEESLIEGVVSLPVGPVDS